REFRPRDGEPAAYRRAAFAGRECLRHPAPRHAGAHQGSRERSDGKAERLRTMAKAKKTTETQACMYDIISQPVITEKSTMGSQYSQVTFKVPSTATKPQIKTAVETLFSVKVKGVNTLVAKGKTKRFKGMLGRRSDVKKAIVTLEEGQTIDVGVGV